MHSFDSGSSEKRKRDNWKLLAKFFKKKRIPLQPAEVDAIVACKEDAAIKVLRRVHDFVHGAAGRAEKPRPSRRPEGGPGPDSTKPRAAKPTRREQLVHARRQAPRAEPRRAAHHRDEGGSDAEDGGGSYASQYSSRERDGGHGYGGHGYGGGDEYGDDYGPPDGAAPDPWLSEAAHELGRRHYAEPSGVAADAGYAESYRQSPGPGATQAFVFGGSAAVHHGAAPGGAGYGDYGSEEEEEEPGYAAAGSYGYGEAAEGGYESPLEEGVGGEDPWPTADDMESAAYYSDEEGPAGPAGAAGAYSDRDDDPAMLDWDLPEPEPEAAAPSPRAVKSQQGGGGGYARLHSGGSAAAPRAKSSAGTWAGHAGAKKIHILEDFKPYTLKDYKQKNPKEYWQLSKLGPDLDVDKLQEARARKDKVRAMSSQIRSRNHTRTQAARPAQAKVKPLSSRQKALQYARSVPKPPPVRVPLKEAEHNCSFEFPEPAEDELSELEALELQHMRDTQAVDAIRKQLMKAGM